MTARPLACVINGTARTLVVPPMSRLLDALRLAAGLPGTKEGCGEGECGACTVLLDGEPVNACLVASGQCQGRRIVTVEGLETDGELSPLQCSFVERGGAQCGICTPGMLLSADALLARTPDPTDDEIRDAIAGNLCRCTGYARIVEAIRDAARSRHVAADALTPVVPTSAAALLAKSRGKLGEKMKAAPPVAEMFEAQTVEVPALTLDETSSAPERPTLTGIGELVRGRNVHALVGLEGAELFRPSSVDAAVAMLGEARARGESVVVLAGGTDWIVDRHALPVERGEPIDRVIDVTAAHELRSIAASERDGERILTLGAGVTYWELRHHPVVLREIPMLAHMAADVGAVQIQTRGTLGGNLVTASPAADGSPALMALGARVILKSARGSRTLTLEEFFTGYRKTALAPDELLVAIELAIPSPRARMSWRKVGTRLAQAISKVALAAVVERDDSGIITRARFGMASVAAVTHPLPTVRALATGKRFLWDNGGRRGISPIPPADPLGFDGEAADRAVEADIAPIDDVRSTGDYRLHVAKALVKQALEPER